MKYTDVLAELAALHSRERPDPPVPEVAEGRSSEWRRLHGVATEVTKGASDTWGGPTAPQSRLAREEWSDNLSGRLHQQVSQETPAGLGAWETAWKMVSPQDTALVDALAAWEATGDSADKQRVIRAAEEYVRAWRRAAAAYRAHAT